MDIRGSGILLHITSLPSPFGVGDLGPAAYRFADFLAETRQSYWQVLPLNPTAPIYGNSPYSSDSTFAGNILLISPELLVHDGFLTEEEIHEHPSFPDDHCDYTGALSYKTQLLTQAFERFKNNGIAGDSFGEFKWNNSRWLDNHALFVALKKHFNGKPWNRWPAGIRDRNPDDLESMRNTCRDDIELEMFLQYLFSRQWFAFKEYCNGRNIQLIGDIPIYVSYDSADAWTHSNIFKLNHDKTPDFMAGVPPDYFSATGQLWGNPVYNWDILRSTGYDWWVQRIAHVLNLYNIIRIDHFRGLVAYWEVPGGEKTAINGTWVNVPVDDFIGCLRYHFQHLPIIAEDLGIITQDVREVMGRYGFPGMKILLFAFGEDNPMHIYLPHTYERNCVVYTGTHDNNTARGWFDSETSPEMKERLFRYIGREVSPDQIHWEMIRLAMGSVADTVIIPMQDILGLGSNGRMNTPSVAYGNWEWRLLPTEPNFPALQRLQEMTVTYGRGSR